MQVSHEPIHCPRMIGSRFTKFVRRFSLTKLSFHIIFSVVVTLSTIYFVSLSISMNNFIFNIIILHKIKINFNLFTLI